MIVWDIVDLFILPRHHLYLEPKQQLVLELVLKLAM